MPLLTKKEAFDATESFVCAVYGRDVYSRWKMVKEQMKFVSEREYVSWLLDLASYYVDNDESGGCDEVQGKEVGGVAGVREEGRGDPVVSLAAHTSRSSEYVGMMRDRVNMSGVELLQTDSYSDKCAEEVSNSEQSASGALDVGVKVETVDLVEGEELEEKYQADSEKLSAPLHANGGSGGCDEYMDMQGAESVEVDQYDNGLPDRGLEVEYDIRDTGEIPSTIGVSELHMGSEAAIRPSTSHHMKPLTTPTRTTGICEPTVTSKLEDTKIPVQSASRCASGSVSVQAADLVDQCIVTEGGNKQLAVTAVATAHCPHCDFSSQHKKNLTQHIRTVHLRILPHSCPVEGCGYASSRRHHLASHLITRHGHRGEHVCPQCDRSFSLPATLRNHLTSCSPRNHT